jgi:DNA replication protein DnaC
MNAALDRPKPKMITLSTEALQEARIPKAFWLTGIDDYFAKPEALKQVDKYIRMSAEALDKGTGLFFRGKKLSGKTFLMTLTLKSLMAKGFQVHYFTFDELTESNLGHIPTLEKFSPKLFATQIVGIDSVNVPTHDVYKNSLLRFIRHRVDSGLPFFLSTTLTREDGVDHFHEQYGDEIFDLVSNNTVPVKCFADAFQMQKFFDNRKHNIVAAHKGE